MTSRLVPLRLPLARRLAAILAAAAQIASAQTGPTLQGGQVGQQRIAGRIVRSTDGHPVPNAVVTLQNSVPGAKPRAARAPNSRGRANTGPNDVLASTRTDAEGRYRFASQGAGKYRLRTAAAGYVAAAYQEHEGFSTAIVLGAGIQTDSLVLELVPSAVIAGRVLDEAGEAVQRAQLTLYRENPNAAGSDAATQDGENRVQRARNAIANDDGSFEFAGLAPGRYYLSVTGTPWYAVHPRAEAENASQPYRSSIDPALDVAYPELFYPSSTASTGASPIRIQGGERVAANFTMQPERALTLRVRLPADGAQNGPFPQVTRSVFGVSEPVMFQVGGQTGQEVLLVGLTPGRYQLQSLSRGNRLPSEAVAVDLASNSDAVNMPATNADDTATVTILLHSLGGGPLPNEIQLNQRSDRPGLVRPGVQSQQIKGTNETTLPGVPTGDYRFTLFSEGRPLYVVGMNVDGRTSADKRLHVAGKGDVKVDLLLTTYAPALEGFAQRDGKAVAGSMVVLVPAGADSSPELFRRDQSDLDGSFRLNDVVPGNYLLIAIEDGWKLPRWNDAAALAPYLAYAVPVTVATAGSGTVRILDAAVVQGR